jgi:hypothetical protein
MAEKALRTFVLRLLGIWSVGSPIKPSLLTSKDEETMDKGSERIVDEAHKVMKRRAKSILEPSKHF